MFKNSQKAVSLYLALIIMFILIAIGLGVSLIIVSQMKMIRGMGDSVVAFYAADTGIERTLYETRAQGSTKVEFSGSLGIADYKATKVGNKWQSVGTSKGVKRAIEISTLMVCQDKTGGSCSGLSQANCTACSTAACSWVIPPPTECSGPSNFLCFDMFGGEKVPCVACGCTWDAVLEICKGKKSCPGKDQPSCSACVVCSWSTPSPYCTGSLNCSAISDQPSCGGCSQCEWIFAP